MKKQSENEIICMHRLPGRLRLRFSPALPDVKELIKAVCCHEGLANHTYNPVSGSLVMKYDLHHISEAELMVRCALAWSDISGGRVLLRKSFSSSQSGFLPVVSGISLLAAGLPHALGLNGGIIRVFDLVAGVATAAAVSAHALEEAGRRGTVDPEVFSLFYLLRSFAQGSLLGASAITWLATFARHLVDTTCEDVYVSYEKDKTAIIEPVKNQEKAEKLFSLVKSGLNTILSVEQTGRGDLFEDLRILSQAHGNRFEGIESSVEHVPVKIG